MRRTTRIRGFGLATFMVALLAASACGGSDDSGSAAAAAAESDAAESDTASSSDNATASEQATGDPDAEALVFAGCMRENGVDMPDPGPGEDGFFDTFHGLVDDYDQATLQQAIDSCQSYLPTYVAGAHGEGDEEDQLALAECLREQGLDVSDNLFQDGELGEIPEDDLRAGLEACRDVVAGGDQ